MPDRIYSIQYNGRIYEVRAPETAMPSELFSFVRQQAGGGSKPEEEGNLLEKIPVVGGALASAADLPLNLVSGLAGTTKSLTDVAGAGNVASEFLDDVSKYAMSLTSAQSREDAKTAAAIRKEAEGKGIWEEVKAAARSFVVNPLDTAASVVGSAVPFALAAASGAGLPAAAALGVASGVGTVKGSVSEAVYNRAREAGVSEEQAKLMAEEAQAYGGENLDMIALGGALGGIASATGLDKTLGRAIAKRAVEDVVEQQVARGVTRRAVTAFGAEALPEAAQAGQERLAQNIAQQRAGYETDLTAGVAGAAAFEGLAGGVLGGITGVAERGAPPPAATEEEILGERQALEAEIADTGIPEAQDPKIRALAADIIQAIGVDPATAIEIAVDERDQIQAQAKKAEAGDAATGTDLGGREPDVPSVDGSTPGGAPAGVSTDTGSGAVGAASVPTGEPVVGAAAVEPTLEPQAAPEPLTVQSYVDRYIAGEGRGETAADKEMQLFRFDNPDEIEAEFQRRVSKSGTAAAQAAPAPTVEEAPPVAVTSLPQAKKLVTPERITAATEMIKTTLATPDFGGFEITPTEINQVAQKMVRTPGLDASTAIFNVLGLEKRVEEETAFEAAPTTIEETQVVPTVAGETQVAPPTVAETATREKVALPPAIQEVQDRVDQFNPGFEIRYNPEDKRRPYKYGIPGQKDIYGSTSLASIESRILNERPVQPKQVIEGVPVKQMPAGEARGTKTESKRQPPLQIEPPSIAGKLTPAQEEQQRLLLGEIDTARNARDISNAERTELVDMLRTPEGRELERSPEWTLASAIQNDIDKLKQEGSDLRTEEKIVEKAKDGPDKTAKKKELDKRAKDIAKRTKAKAAELAEAKSGIYERTRNRLNELKKTRSDKLAQAKRNYERGLITEPVYKRILRETRPEPVMFRKAKGKAAGITLEELNAAVKNITDRWGARLEPTMVQSAADLPPAIRKELEDLDRTDAFGFYKDGKAYLIADNMNGVEDVAPTLYHEALGHLGLRKLFRDGLDKVLTDIYATNKNVAALADKWLSANRDLYAEEENPVARAVEEVLASASETGPLRASRFDKLVNFIKDFARKYLGFDFKFSDREVRSILAMAHEQALSGEDTVMGSSSMMFNAPQQQQAKATVAAANISVEDAIEKVVTTTADQMDVESYSRGFFNNLGDTLKGKTLKNWLDGLKAPSASGGFIGRGGLNVLPTDGFSDYADTKIGVNPTTRELRKAIDAAERLNGNRAAIRRMLNKAVVDLKNYLLSNADSMVFQGKRLKAFNVATDYNNYYNIDGVALSDAKTNEDAYKADAIWRRYTKLLKKPDLDAETKADYETKLKKRQTELDGAMEIWSKLSKQGRDLYKRIRDMHRYMYKTRQFFMRRKLRDLKDAGLSDEAVEGMMASIRAEEERLNDMVNAPAEEDAHGDYPEVPLGQFHREYFPKRRYGQFWLRIKKTKFGEPILRFYESAAERDADWTAAAEKLGVSKEDKNYFDLGNDVETQLGDDLDPNSAFVKTLNMISKIDPTTFTDAKKAKLRGDVYQLYLLSTPEGSGRKQFIKSKNRLGWSSDILRTVGASAEEYATDISRLRFGTEIDRAFKAAKSSIDDIEAGKKALARDFISNLEGRIDGEMETQTKSLATRIVPWANQLAYISFLTAPATALVQVTALPMRVAPNLWGKYGMAATTRAMGRYMNVFNNLPKLESNAKAARKTFRIPTLMESDKVKGSKRHRNALTRATDEYGLIIPLSEFTMGRERTPQTATQGRASEVTQQTYDAMTYLFDASEQLTREVAFMAAYDLEFDKLEKAKLSPEERQTKAIIAAKDVVNYTLGNYSNLNRPPIMKGSELARALFLFKQYSVITTRFFVQSTRAIFGKNTPVDERVAAMKEMTGVLGMSFLMGGVTAMPLFSLGMMTLQALQDAFGDDEERRERMKKQPLTADSVEMQFRYEWLPEHFGQPMITPDKGKKITLSDIILNGAVSEATGWNFGSRVSLDLMGMWFRAPKDADTWTQTLNNALVENIPGASASLNVVGMGEEVVKGDVLKGLELGLPAVFRGPLKAYRLQTEGLRTQTEKIKLRNDEIENSAIVGAVLGMNPTQIAKLQQQNRDVLSRTKQLADKKSELLGDYKRAVRRIQNGDADGQEKAREAFKAIMEYNRKIGNPYFGISYANIYRSLTGAAAEEKYDIQGMGLNETESAYAKELLKDQ